MIFNPNVVFLLTAGAEILALVLRLAAMNVYAMWALALSTVPLLTQVAQEFQEALSRRGNLNGANLELAGVEVVIVALALLSGWRFSRLLFWLGWTLNLTLVALFGYILVLWHPFA